MEAPDLLIRHTANWASEKGREFDPELLRLVVDLRRQHDDLPLGAWPPGSAERLLLTTWPAYGPPPPDLETLRVTLDTFWGFLRATGRMARGSANPAELRKEAKRALPRLADAYSDPARHSMGRVLADFGRSIGLDLDGAADLAELQARMAQIQEAWNGLPQEERLRRMPDPSPKSLRGEAMSAMLPGGTAYPPWPELEDDDVDDDLDDDLDVDLDIEPADVGEVARTARESEFVLTCLRLADWVGSGRPATARGLLKPAVAREAYRFLDLWPWERRYEDLLQVAHTGERFDASPEVDAIRADASLNAWRSAGDCLALDRYWSAACSAGLVQLRGTKAVRSDLRPQTDEEWRVTALRLLLGLTLRLGDYRVEPLIGLLGIGLVAERGPVPVAAVRAWWDSRLPDSLRGLPMGWPERLDQAIFFLDDGNLWSWQQDHFTLTALGHDFALALLSAVDEGLFHDGR